MKFSIFNNYRHLTGHKQDRILHLILFILEPILQAIIFIVICFFIIGIIAPLSGCTSRKDANHALKSAGYTDIKTNGYAWFACSKDDFHHTKFTATNVRGKIVSGTVCSGLFFKNATIRF